MQVQSASDPPKKLVLGERAIMADGNEYNLFQFKEAGKPVDVVYPTEGTPLIVGPNGIFKNAPNPNAARLFQCYCFTPQCQQLIVDFGALRSMHPVVKDKAGPHLVPRDQNHEGGSRRRGKDERGDQGTL